MPRTPSMANGVQQFTKDGSSILPRLDIPLPDEFNTKTIPEIELFMHDVSISWMERRKLAQHVRRFPDRYPENVTADDVQLNCDEMMRLVDVLSNK